MMFDQTELHRLGLVDPARQVCRSCAWWGPERTTTWAVLGLQPANAPCHTGRARLWLDNAMSTVLCPGWVGSNRAAEECVAACVRAAESARRLLED